MRQTVSQSPQFLVINSYEDFERIENQQDQTAQYTAERVKSHIQVPFFGTIGHTGNSDARPSDTQESYQLSTSYLRTQPITGNECGCTYELQEEDLKFLESYNQNQSQITESFLEQAIQLLELKRFYEQYVTFKPGEGVDPGRNFQRQWELLKSHPLINEELDYQIIQHYQQRTEKLERPLLRVFMRAIENDSRLCIAFRPSRPYKQKRLKRIGMPIQEFEIIEKRMRTENSVGLHCAKMVAQREKVKHAQIELQKLQWQADQDLDIVVPEIQSVEGMINDSIALQIGLKELRMKEVCPSPAELVRNRSEQPHQIIGPYQKYKECAVEDCQFDIFARLDATYLTEEVIDIMNDQYATMKWKGSQVEWPENPTVLRHIDYAEEDTLVIKPTSIRGQQQNGNSLIIGLEDRTIIMRDTKEVHSKEDSDMKRNRKFRKAVTISLMDPVLKRQSTSECVRVDFDHFLSHRQSLLERTQLAIETMRKVCQKKRLDLLRRERQIRLKMLKKKKKEELVKRRRNILKIRLKLEDLAIKKPPPVLEVLKTPIAPVMSAQVSANKFILRKFDPDREPTNKIKFQIVQESPSKFKLMCKAESPQTLKLQLGQESHESCSLETHPRNLFLSKPIDEFKQILA